jgi:hypothetical protein
MVKVTLLAAGTWLLFSVLCALVWIVIVGAARGRLARARAGGNPGLDLGRCHPRLPPVQWNGAPDVDRADFTLATPAVPPLESLIEHFQLVDFCLQGPGNTRPPVRALTSGSSAAGAAGH